MRKIDEHRQRWINRKDLKMIYKDKDERIFTMRCNFCGRRETFKTKEGWDAMIAASKELKWQILKREGEWRHFCEKCAWRPWL